MRRGEWRKYRSTRPRFYTTLDTGSTGFRELSSTYGMSKAQWRHRTRVRAGVRRDFFVAETSDGSWVGSLGLTMKKTPSGLVGELSQVWVDPTHRGKPADGSPRVVHQLIEHAAQRALRRGAHSLVLGVADDNARARAAYEREGFVPEGPKPETEHPTTLMALTINESRKRVTVGHGPKRKNSPRTH